MENNHSLESKEPNPKLLFKLTLMRHEKPFYKDEGHDLTPEGVEGSIASGKHFREDGIISDNDEIHLVHSPTKRAKGTLDFIAQGAELEDLPKRSINQLRKSDMYDTATLNARFKELDFDMEKISEDHYKNPIFDERPDIIEPQSHKKERLYRAFEYLVRWFEKHPSEDKKPHVISVSHFELITHIIDDVFGIENIGRYHAPSFGESVYIEAYGDTDSNENIRLKVTYGSKTKYVLFDRKNRLIKEI